MPALAKVKANYTTNSWRSQSGNWKWKWKCKCKWGHSCKEVAFASHDLEWATCPRVGQQSGQHFHFICFHFVWFDFISLLAFELLSFSTCQEMNSTLEWDQNENNEKKKTKIIIKINEINNNCRFKCLTICLQFKCCMRTSDDIFHKQSQLPNCVQIGYTNWNNYGWAAAKAAYTHCTSIRRRLRVH